MNERKLRNFCMALLVFSILARTLLATGAEARFAAAITPAVAAVLLPDESVPEPKKPTIRLWPVVVAMSDPTAHSPPEEDLPSEESPSVQPPLVFSPEEAEAIPLAGACTYPVDKAALLTRPSSLAVAQEGPTVLIVHTHTSEAYTQAAGWFYDATEAFRTVDTDHSVVRVGAELAAVLEEAGIETLHETGLNDHPNYDGAYNRMLATIEAYLAAYPTIQVVLDVHRDAAPDNGGGQAGFSAEIDGETCAQVMLVVGTDEGGLSHPNWEENLANALKIQAILNRDAPGLCRPLDLRTERFNQHTAPGALLAEFGAAGNTLPEALAAARHFGAALARLLQGEKIS